MSFDKEIGVVTVVYNTPGLITRAVRSIQPHVGRVLVIDNSDIENETYGECDRLQNLPRVKVIHTGRNLFHGPGLCFGISNLLTPYIICMDSDTELKDPGLLSEMKLTLQDEGVYGVGRVEQADPKTGQWLNTTQNPELRGLDYLHPYFCMFRRETYYKHPPFIHHGAPAIRTMKAIAGQLRVVDIPDIMDRCLHDRKGTHQAAGDSWFGNWESVDEELEITIITPVWRPELLQDVARSIPPGMRWICVFGGGSFPEGFVLPENAESYVIPETGGLEKRNYALELITSGYVYFLDDDTQLHPNFLHLKKVLGSDFIHFNQQWADGRRRIGGVVRRGLIDAGSFLVRRDVVGLTRFVRQEDEKDPVPDGRFAEEVYLKAKHPLYIDKTYSTYNSLQNRLKQLQNGYSVIIPTMYFHPKALQEALVKYEATDPILEVILINNNQERYVDFSSFAKVRVLGDGKNMYVNPAWNLGVQNARCGKIIIANDDLTFYGSIAAVLGQLDQVMRPGDIYAPSPVCFNEFLKQPAAIFQTTKNPNPLMNYGGGAWMVMHRSTYIPIPSQFLVWYGDLFLYRQRTGYTFRGVLGVETAMRGTTSKLNLTGWLEKEKQAYHAYWKVPLKPTISGTSRPVQIVSDVPVVDKPFDITVMLVWRRGGDFHFSDVELLSRKIQETTPRCRVVCITDAVREEVCLETVILIPMRYQLPGWWAKINLFAPEYGQFRPCFYVDLDSAVLRDIREIKPVKTEDFVMLRDFYRPATGASGLMWIPRDGEQVSAVWKSWRPDRMRYFRGDQNYITAVTIPNGYFQDFTSRVASFKPQPGKYLENPDGKTVVCFHGKPRIPEARKLIKWVDEYAKK